MQLGIDCQMARRQSEKNVHGCMTANGFHLIRWEVSVPGFDGRHSGGNAPPPPVHHGSQANKSGYSSHFTVALTL
jgi:hypothetical protein